MDIDQRIDTLEQRLSSMERKSRAWRILALLLLVALVGGVASEGVFDNASWAADEKASAAQKNAAIPEVIRARKFEVVAPNGKTSVVITTQKESGGSAEFYFANGKTGAVIGLSDWGGGAVFLDKTNTSVCAVIGVARTGGHARFTSTIHDGVIKSEFGITQNGILKGGDAFQSPPQAPRPKSAVAVATLQRLGVKIFRNQQREVIGLQIPFTSKITDAELVHLKWLPKLQGLNLSTSGITGAGLVHLKGLTNLERLDLSKCTFITDAGLVHLKGLTKLQTLYIHRTNITDAGLLHLKGLTNLKSLWLYRTRTTVAGVAALQKALPNCTIGK